MVEASEITAEAAPVGEPAIPAAPVKRGKKKLVLVGIVLIALVAAGFYGKEYWETGRFMVETDDAYVAADITLISSRVQGYVAEAPVGQNAAVKAGDVLLRLDDGDYRIALDVAKGRVDTAGKTLLRIDAQTKAAEAGVAQASAMQDMAQAQLRAAKTNSGRVSQLANGNIVAQAQLDKAVEALDTATASVASADAAVANAQAQVGVLHAQRAEAEGTRHELELAAKQAQRNLDLTVLHAPADGTLGSFSLETGDLVTPGARLGALVPLKSLYIDANFKETQMAGISQGATVHIRFDSIPDTAFEGRVASIAPATGSVFSLIPAENATGNFTKVVQRVPVRIDIPQAAIDSGLLRAGLSAVVEVDNRTGAAAGKAK
ncbi:HlyD family secretion protein [Pseudorhodobacter sp.]|uniref:HlyD family secretion protein n=1 Tax=Pseudorhodobacter sp. TaxID=1934400 RepID=UPI002649E06D|nr:HlyD family secretion protein [Pseudorhodobacter sp.]MDN5787973.1 HlyD family secretion protein [Pseudorhodobacter sp.]